jgi:hypothetical protein
MWHRNIVSFPWTNLITAVSTLIAAIGATYVKGTFDARAEQRRLQHERNSRRTDVRAEAYSDFVKVAHADARLLGQSLFQLAQELLDKTRIDEIVTVTSSVVDEFNGALGRVEIVGSTDAAKAALEVARAARILGARCNHAYQQGTPFDVPAAEAELGELSRTIGVFAASCRDELNESA